MHVLASMPFFLISKREIGKYFVHFEQKLCPTAVEDDIVEETEREYE